VCELFAALARARGFVYGNCPATLNPSARGEKAALSLLIALHCSPEKNAVHSNAAVVLAVVSWRILDAKAALNGDSAADYMATTL